MKQILLIFAVTISMYTRADSTHFRCELFKNNLLIARDEVALDQNGEAQIDLGHFDIYRFGGLMVLGQPTIITDESGIIEKGNGISKTVKGSDGSFFRIFCYLK